MDITLIGPGALGCLVSSVLARGSRHGDNLNILDHKASRARELDRRGITYQCGDLKEHHMIPAHSSSQTLERVDVIFLCVKSYDVENALNFAAPLLLPRTLLIFLQNGISHLETGDSIGQATPVYGSTTDGATLLGPGQVRHAGKGITHLGFLSDNIPAHASKLLTDIQARLQAGGMETLLTDEITLRLWTKLFINVGINALTAIWNCRNGELLENDSAKEQMKEAITEAVMVAQQLGIRPQHDPFEATLGVCQSTAANISSMLQDVRAKKTTEIEAINGAIVRAGARLNIATPTNQELFEKVKRIENEY